MKYFVSVSGEYSNLCSANAILNELQILSIIGVLHTQVSLQLLSVFNKAITSDIEYYFVFTKGAKNQILDLNKIPVNQEFSLLCQEIEHHKPLQDRCCFHV